MVTDDDPMARAFADAEEKVIRAGMSGGESHLKVTDAMVVMASFNYVIRRMQKIHADQASTIIHAVSHPNSNGKRAQLKAQAPGLTIGGGLIGLLAILFKLLGV